MTELMKTRILEEATHIENDVHHSAKGHYEEANYWTRFHLLLGIPASLLSAIAGASALAQFENHAIIAGFLAIIVAALTGVTTFLNPNEKATAHQNAGNKYGALRNRVRTFYNLDMLLQESELDLTEQVKTFMRLRDELNESSPPISNTAYKLAKKRILEKQRSRQNVLSKIF